MGIFDNFGDKLLGKDTKGVPGSRPSVMGSLIGPNTLSGIPIIGRESIAGGPYSLLRVPRNFYFELRVDGKIDAVVSLPYDPESFSISRPQPLSLVHTFGGVIREHGEIRTHVISMEGRSGIQEREAHNRFGDTIFRSGQIAMREFDEFLKYYQHLCSQYHGAKQGFNKSLVTLGTGDFNTLPGLSDMHKKHGPALILRSLEDDFHVYVEPVQFTYERNVKTYRHDIGYSLDMLAYGYAYDTKPFFPMKELEGIVGNAIGVVTGTIATATNAITNVNRDYIQGVRNMIDRVYSVTRALDNVANASGALVNNACAAWCDFTGLDDAFSETFGLDVDDTGYARAASAARTEAYDGGESPYEEFNQDPESGPAVTQRQDALRVQRQIIDYGEDTPIRLDDEERVSYGTYAQSVINMRNAFSNKRGDVPRQAFNNYFKKAGAIYYGEFLKNESNLSIITNAIDTDGETGRHSYNFVSYYLQEGENLYRVAAKILGDANRWREIKDYNNWSDARRNARGQIPQEGEEIRIKVDDLPNSTGFEENGDINLTDIAMPYNDLQFDEKSGDFLLVSGPENLKQAIKNKLLVAAGDLQGYEDFGLPTLRIDVEDSNKKLAAAVIRESLVRDPRVLDVPSVVLTLEGDTLFIECMIQPVQGDTFTARSSI